MKYILDFLEYLDVVLKHSENTINNYNVDLVDFLDKKVISIKQSKEIIDEVLSSKEKVETIIKNRGLEQISDTNSLKEIINKVLSENETSVNDYLSGHDRALKYLMGQIMKETKGNANPLVVNQMLIETLNDKK